MRLVLLVLVCAACNIGSDAGVGQMIPTYDGYQARLDMRVGTPVNHTIDEWGAPESVQPAGAGDSLYTWVGATTLDSPGRIVTDPKTGDQIIHPPETLRIACKTTLRVDAAGIVQHAQASGPRCLGTMPSGVEVAAFKALAVKAAGGAPSAVVPTTPEPGVIAAPPADEPQADAPTDEPESSGSERKGFLRGLGKRQRD